LQNKLGGKDLQLQVKLNSHAVFLLHGYCFEGITIYTFTFQMKQTNIHQHFRVLQFEKHLIP
jgi:hypothetical protein